MADKESITKAQALADSIKDAPRYVLVTVSFVMVCLSAIAASWHLATLAITQCIGN